MISKETMQQLKENCALATTYNGQLYRNDDDMDYITISRWMEKIYMLLLVMDQDHDAIKDYVENDNELDIKVRELEKRINKLESK